MTGNHHHIKIVQRSCTLPRHADLRGKGCTVPFVPYLELDDDERSGLPTDRFTPEQAIKIYDFNVTHFLFHTIFRCDCTTGKLSALIKC
jgi:hypothetical protein